MYTEQLEAIIDAALADGVLTDKEREVLHKRAAQEGIDADELDVVIEGRLAKMKKEEDWLRPTPPPVQPLMSNKMGNVMKCPNCGAAYEPGTVKCPECGHVFQNVDAVSSAKKFSDGIQNIIEKWSVKIEQASKEEKYDGAGKRLTHKVYDAEKTRNAEIKNFMRSFPIPKSKDDLLEFISSMAANRSGDYEEEYRSKLKEAVNKAKVFFPDDPQFSPLIEKYTKLSWENLSRETRAGIVIAILFALMLILAIIFDH